MPRGRRRKIEVPRDNQPQFELGDTPKDYREKKGERGERVEGEERTGGEGQRQDRKRENSRE